MNSKTYSSCRCVVVDCPTNNRKPGDRGKVFSLPTNKVKRTRWLELLGRCDLREKPISNLRGSTGYGVCSRHFQNHHFGTVEKKTLNRNAEPDPYVKALEDDMDLTRTPTPPSLTARPSGLSSVPIASLAPDMDETMSSASVPILCRASSNLPSFDSGDLETTTVERHQLPKLEKKESSDQTDEVTTPECWELAERRIHTRTLRSVRIQHRGGTRTTDLTPRKKFIITKLRKAKRTVAVMNSLIKMVNLQTDNIDSRPNEIIKKFLRSAMK